MTADNPPAGQQAMWFYAINNQRFGPATREQVVAVIQSGQGAGMMVWREGMVQWLPVSAVSEFGGVAVPPPVMPERVMPDWNPQALRQAKQVRAAKQNCIALFVVLILSVFAALAAAAASAAHGGPRGAGNYGCGGGLGLIGAIFAVIYFPLRWKVIMSLHPAYKVLGLIGGFGLIAMLAVGLLAVAAVG